MRPAACAAMPVACSLASRASHGARSVLRVCAYAYVEHFRLRLVSAHAVAARVSLDPCALSVVHWSWQCCAWHACVRPTQCRWSHCSEFPEWAPFAAMLPTSFGTLLEYPHPLTRARPLALALTHARTLARAHAREHTHAPASSACAHTQVRRVGARAAGWTATRSRGGRGAYPRATAAVLQCCVYCRGTESTDAYGAKASTAARQTRAANAVTRRRPAVATCGCVSVFGDEGTGGAREGRGVGAAAGARGADVCTRMAECGVCVQAREQLREAYTAFARVEHCSFAEFTRVRTNHRVPTEYR